MTDETQVTENASAPVEQAEEPQTPEPGATGEESQGGGPPKNGIQQRISELVNQRKAAEQQAEYWKHLAEQAQKPAEPPAQQEPGAPTPDSFRTYEDYLDALADYKVDQRLKARQAEQAEQSRADQLRQKQMQTQQAFQAKAAVARSKFPDFDVVVGNPNLPITEHMVEAFATLDNGAEVAYQLASNPMEVVRISQLSPTQQALEVGRMSTRANKVPPAAVEGVQGASGGAKDPMSLSPDEWAKWRNEQKRGR